MPSDRDTRRGTARSGEALAALFLRVKGYRIEARNWRCALGELDIVARQGGTLVFVEVKTRRGASAGRPEEAVTTAKQQRLVRLAQAYLLARRAPEAPCRFDVIAVERARFGPRIRHLRAAFRADGLL